MRQGSGSGSGIRLHRPSALPSGNQLALELEIPADLERRGEAVDLIAEHCFAEGPPPSSHTLFRLRVLLMEALSNSILFGAGGDPNRRVQVSVRVDRERIRLEVTDDGPGFDPAEIPDPTLPAGLDRPVGRGLFLIRHLADQVEFNEQGNTIWMTLARC